ncbi:MAG TPA: lysine--tRNA ligase [Candidatus Binatia bacterium]|nr:lysine--tRNA ligase [Candidatus Binatia bacterium]
MTDDLRRARLEKLEKLRALGVPAYAERFDCTHVLADAMRLPDGAAVRVAGRLLTLRSFGRLAFAHVMDRSGRAQVSFERGVLSAQDDAVVRLLDLGDFVGIEGELWTTQKGERTVRTRRLSFLAKSLRPLPEKWHGLKDHELRYRRRYLDLIANPDTRDRFTLRSRVIRLVRAFLDARGFLEVETPILQAAASGAAARPFVTRHEALDRPLYLRISPETYLKRLVVGGLERVYEIGKNFRNEGMDPSHLQEFTMLEWYAAYWSYRENMTLVRELIQHVVREVTGGTRVECAGVPIELGGDWPEVSFTDAVRERAGVDLAALDTWEKLAPVARARGLDPDQLPSYPALVDGLYKRAVRPHLVGPVFLVHHPAELVPLARRSSANPRVLDMFQVVVNSWEIVKAYSELIDPVEQRARMLEQQAYRERGDAETMMMEDDYIECMEYGMPPNSGLGLGIDRLVALLAGAESLRDVVLFPAMRDEG